MIDLKNTDIADDCMDAGGRAPKVGALGDAGAVTDLMPHSGKMVLLDRVIEYDDISASAELVVRDDGLLGDGETVPAWAGIEYMAQTIAVYVGIMAKIAGDPIKLGFLLGTRRYKSNVAGFKVGSTLTVRAEKIMQDERLGVFDCRIQGDGVEISANLNVYEPPIDYMNSEHE